MAFGLLITRNDIIKNTPLGGAIDADALLPFIRTAQEKYILNLLGTILYDKLQDDVEATNFFYRLLSNTCRGVCKTNFNLVCLCRVYSI